ncbi:MAG: AAA family ATPase [Kiritimatiellae bacterium]|nr:AAA family ATPase [Kiritimatiellia bacterium]
MPAATVDQVEAEVAKVIELPRVQELGELRTPNYGNDPSELIKNRFLYRKGVCLLLGPTGIGKSAFLMQGGIYLSVGKKFFGIEPGEVYQAQGMRILLIQAENDEGDLAEMRDGVLRGCEDLTVEDRQRALKNMRVCTICDRSGEGFVSALGALLEQEGPFDLVMVDPAFAYLGGDSNSQKDVSHFMRELLNPLLHLHDVGMILAHHTNKPLRGKEKDGWEAGDYAYLGAGSAEWINPSRAALAIRSLGSDSVFELRAAKRGKRIGWKDEAGETTTKQYIAHHWEPGVICWRDATAEEVKELTEKKESNGRPRKVDPMEVLHCVAERPKKNQAFYKQTCSKELDVSLNAIQYAFIELSGQGLVREKPDGRSKVYEVTAKGRESLGKHVSTHDWAGILEESA